MSKLSFSTFLSILRILPTLRPILAELIVFVEGLLPDSGQGQAKLDEIKKLLAGMWDSLDVLRVTFEEAWPVISGVVGVIVSVFNRKGWPKPEATEPDKG